MRGRRHDTLGGGLIQKKLFTGTVSTFRKNEHFHCDPHKILHIIDITYVLVTVLLSINHRTGSNSSNF